MATENYKIDTSWVREYMSIIKKDHNIHRAGEDDFTRDSFRKFNRYRQHFPETTLSKTVAYVFITRPDLNLLESSSTSAGLHEQVMNDASTIYIYKTSPDVIRSLTGNLSGEHDFLPFLCGRAASFETSDEVIDTVDYGETLTGHKITYGKHNIESKSAGSISIKYTDDHALNVYKIHKMWTDYIAKVYRGEWSPKDEHIRKKVLDYASSIYYILCSGDGETILFWTKYYGVFPVNTPSSNLSWSMGDVLNSPDYNIQYRYAFKEDYNPLALAEFNMNSKGGKGYITMYDYDSLSSGQTFVGAPFIDTVTHHGQYFHKLRFRRK